GRARRERRPPDRGRTCPGQPRAEPREPPHLRREAQRPAAVVAESRSLPTSPGADGRPAPGRVVAGLDAESTGRGAVGRSPLRQVVAGLDAESTWTPHGREGGSRARGRARADSRGSTMLRESRRSVKQRDVNPAACGAPPRTARPRWSYSSGAI